MEPEETEEPKKEFKEADFVLFFVENINTIVCLGLTALWVIATKLAWTASLSQNFKVSSLGMIAFFFLMVVGIVVFLALLYWLKVKIKAWRTESLERMNCLNHVSITDSDEW